jgi:hypothetical protein
MKTVTSRKAGGTSMGRSFKVNFAVAVFAAVLFAPAPAEARGDLACDLSVPVELSPGISQHPSGGALRSSRVGDITCIGRVTGTWVAGKGRVMRMQGAYGVGDGLTPPGSDDCASGVARGTLSAQLRTITLETEYVDVVLSFESYRVGTAWMLSGRLEDPDGESTPFSSQLAMISDQDCVTTPLTRGVLRGRLVNGGQADRVGERPSRGSGDPASGRCGRRVQGSWQADRLTGAPDGDLMRGLGGADVLRGLAGDDCLFGDGGSDRLAGAAGDDFLSGGTGADTVRGGAGNDSLSGGRSSDLIDAGRGDDSIDAADGGPDRVRCGHGTDDVRVDRSDRVSACERMHVSDATGHDGQAR